MGHKEVIKVLKNPVLILHAACFDGYFVRSAVVAASLFSRPQIFSSLLKRRPRPPIYQGILLIDWSY